MPPQDTRQALLAAARTEFADHGLAGARVDRIAAAAGYNKERIYANFGNKEKLFEAALADAFTEVREATQFNDDGIAGFVRRIFDFHRTKPEFIRMIAWESLQGSTPIVDEQTRRAAYRERVGELAATLGVQPDADTARLLFVLIALGFMTHLMPVIAHLTTDGHAQSNEDLDAMREFLVAFAVRACDTPVSHGKPSATTGEVAEGD